MTLLVFLIYFCLFTSFVISGPLFIFSTSTTIKEVSTAASEVSTYDAWLDDLEELQDDNDEKLIDENMGKRRKKQTKLWDHWGKWSSCSASCGVGKMTRWRHCVSEGCALGEKEAQIKSCSEQPC